MSLVIQIGNSDNKLTRERWAEFIHTVNISLNGFIVHFRGGSAAEAPWENYCWVVEPHHNADFNAQLWLKLGIIAAMYEQESIAVIEGPVQFVAATR